jgi:hypothetical protein
LVRNVERDGSQVDLDELVSDGHNQEQARSFRADEPTQPKYDAPLVFAHNFDRRR